MTVDAVGQSDDGLLHRDFKGLPSPFGWTDELILRRGKPIGAKQHSPPVGDHHGALNGCLQSHTAGIVRLVRVPGLHAEHVGNTDDHHLIGLPKVHRSRRGCLVDLQLTGHFQSGHHTVFVEIRQALFGRNHPWNAKDVVVGSQCRALGRKSQITEGTTQLSWSVVGDFNVIGNDH